VRRVIPRGEVLSRSLRADVILAHNPKQSRSSEQQHIALPLDRHAASPCSSVAVAGVGVCLGS
jgi:hypothetical protein